MAETSGDAVEAEARVAVSPLKAASRAAIELPGRRLGEEIAAARSYRAQAKAANIRVDDNLAVRLVLSASQAARTGIGASMAAGYLAAQGAPPYAAAALRQKEIFEYAPLRVKLAVVGQGRASKDQMARTVMALLGHGRAMAFDEADAAGVALCHAFTWRG